MDTLTPRPCITSAAVICGQCGDAIIISAARGHLTLIDRFYFPGGIAVISLSLVDDTKSMPSCRIALSGGRRFWNIPNTRAGTHTNTHTAGSVAVRVCCRFSLTLLSRHHAVPSVSVAHSQVILRWFPVCLEAYTFQGARQRPGELATDSLRACGSNLWVALSPVWDRCSCCKKAHEDSSRQLLS